MSSVLKVVPLVSSGLECSISFILDLTMGRIWYSIIYSSSYRGEKIPSVPEKEKIKLSLFADDMIAYEEFPKFYLKI